MSWRGAHAVLHEILKPLRGISRALETGGTGAPRSEILPNIIDGP